MQTEEMSSAFKPPDPKKQLSVRLRGSLHAKLAAVVEIWRERAQVTGGQESADQVDVPYVVDELFAKMLDEELAQWGGYPDTKAKMAEVLKAVRASAKQ